MQNDMPDWQIYLLVLGLCALTALGVYNIVTAPDIAVLAQCMGQERFVHVSPYDKSLKDWYELQRQSCEEDEQGYTTCRWERMEKSYSREEIANLCRYPRITR